MYFYLFIYFTHSHCNYFTLFFITPFAISIPIPIAIPIAIHSHIIIPSLLHSPLGSLQQTSPRNRLSLLPSLPSPFLPLSSPTTLLYHPPSTSIPLRRHLRTSLCHLLRGAMAIGKDGT